jgi:hypothetical protein
MNKSLPVADEQSSCVPQPEPEVGPQHGAPLTFQYNPLAESNDEIRLISFDSRKCKDIGQNTDCIHLQLNHVSLKVRPVYHALSYVWGSSVKDCKVYVDGKIFLVTRSLAEALRRFRNDESVEQLWADALCINQDDLDEKSKQVQKMRRIFDSAKAVVAWLGPTSQGGDEIMEKIQKLGKRLIMEYSWRAFPEDRGNAKDPDRLPSSRCWQMFQRIAQMLRNQPGFIAKVAKELDLTNVDGEVFPHEQMLEFFNRPIWTRVWIIQEFAVAKDLYLVRGEVKVKYIYFLIVYWVYLAFYEDQKHGEYTGENANAFVARVSAMFPYVSQSLRVMDAMHRWGHIESMRQSSFAPLSELLWSGWRLGATDPRDRIFAFLGLAKDAKALGVEPDYRKSYEEVSIDTAWRLFRQRHLDILSYSHGMRDSPITHNLPSWVPDWSLKPKTVLSTPRFSGDVEFSASGSSSMSCNAAIPHINFSSRCLEILGTLVGDVTNVRECVEFYVPRVVTRNLDAVMCFMSELQVLTVPEDLEVMPTEDERKELVEAMWHIPIAQRMVRAAPEDQRPAYQQKSNELKEAFDVLLGIRQPPASVSGDDDTQWRLEHSHSYFELMCREVNRKRAFRCNSKQPYLGFGPEEMLPGDTVSIFQGAKVPYILRRCDGGGFKLIGEAYLYGLMHGEIMKNNPTFEIIKLV